MDRARVRPVDGYERYDEDVASFWNRIGASGSGALAFALRHPAATWSGLADVRRLPRLSCEPGSGPGGRALLATLRQRHVTRHDFALFGAAVLSVPDDPATMLEGRRQQTMRRMLRKADKAGLTCRAVEPCERIGLLKRANATEQDHRLDTYRVEAPDNDDLLEHPLWRVCELHGRPVLLSVTPVDGEWACLRYFRTLGASEHHTLARWLSTYDLVQQLSARGVRHLLDTEPPGTQTNGVRHFQRMLGFRYVVVTRPVGRAWRLAAAATVAVAAGTATVGTAAATGILPQEVVDVLPGPIGDGPGEKSAPTRDERTPDGPSLPDGPDHSATPAPGRTPDTAPGTTGGATTGTDGDPGEAPTSPGGAPGTSGTDAPAQVPDDAGKPRETAAPGSDKGRGGKPGPADPPTPDRRPSGATPGPVEHEPRDQSRSSLPSHQPSTSADPS